MRLLYRNVVRFEVLTLLVHIEVFCDSVLCGLINIYRSFEVSCRFVLWGEAVQKCNVVRNALTLFGASLTDRTSHPCCNYFSVIYNYAHRFNLVNNAGGGKGNKIDHVYILPPLKRRGFFFHFFLTLHNTNNRLENVSNF